LLVEVEPSELRLSDEPKLTVTIRSQPGVTVTKPPFGESVGEFLIRDFFEPLPTAEGNLEVTQQIYTLEPTRAGKLTIAPVVVRFTDGRTDGDGKEHLIESEALQIEVSTVVGDEAPSLTDLRPSAGPIELPSEGPPVWVWLTLASVLTLLSGVVWYRRRPAARPQPPQLTPRQLAEQELQSLIGRRLAETNVKEFYVEVTAVVRRYIERSTGVRAPEQTTEEFLREILGKTIYADKEQRRLQQFLESADLVKFAGVRPAQTDIDSSIERAREFTQLETEQKEETSA